MELLELPKKLFKPGYLGLFPRTHVMALSSLCVVLAGITALPSDKASATRKVETITLPIHFDEEAVPVEALTEIPSPKENETLSLKTITVKSGDNLSLIFKRAGFNDQVMLKVLNSSEEAKQLASLYPGHKVEFAIDDENNIQRLTYIKSKLSGYELRREGDTFVYAEKSRQADIQIAQASAFITQSLYTAGIDARLDDKLIMELAEIFGWDIDFALDIRKGDHFKVVYEERFLDGEKIGNGSIIAAEFVNQGDSFKAVRYEDSRGEVGYYTPDGKSMRKEFLRAPLDFRRISSNFNPKRLHPVLKTTRPHRGIDYAASRGTPVWSSGNGRVIASGYSKANGNYVFIQHGGNIQTKYLHLQKRLVKKGQKVKQKQKIGTVGSTGLATGPHLHYEFLMNGVHRNPRTIVARLPKAKAISANEYSRFVMETRDIVAQLNEDFTHTQYATAESSDSIKNL